MDTSELEGILTSYLFWNKAKSCPIQHEPEIGA